MKRKENKYIIGTLVVLFILLSLLFIFVNYNRKLTIIESGIKDISLSVFRVIKIPFDYTQDKIEEYNQKKDIYKKYKALKKQNEKLIIENNKYNEIRNELNNLKNSLDINSSLADYDTINSAIIFRDIGYWYDTLTIASGENKGIKKDMAVITTKGLIGRVLKTTKTTSTVKLLTSINEDTKISVKIIDGDRAIYGLLTKFDYKKKTFLIEGISENIEIKKDLLVTTTGMDNIFPSGITIGRVVNTTKDNFDLSIYVEVKSDIDFDDLRYVMVAKRRDIE